MPRPVVLIVEDEIADQAALVQLLAQQLPEVDLRCAASGVLALTEAARWLPDLIVLDVRLPDLDGFEIVRHLRQNPDLAEVPIILATALTDRDSRLEGIDCGADDFVSKPFDAMELLTRIRTIVRLNRFRQLRAERTKLAWTLAHSHDGYVSIDLQGHIGIVSPVARALLPLPPDDALAAQKFLDIVAKWYGCEPLDAWVHWPAPAGGGARRYLARRADAPVPTGITPVKRILVETLETGVDNEWWVRLCPHPETEPGTESG